MACRLKKRIIIVECAVEELLLLRICGKDRTQQCLQFRWVAIRRDSMEQLLQAHMVFHADVEPLTSEVFEKGLEWQQRLGTVLDRRHPILVASERWSFVRSSLLFARTQ